MSFPPPYMNPTIPPPHIMPPMTTQPPAPRTFRNATTISSQPTVYQRPPEPVPQFRGPIITVFVGNISERVPENLIKRILSTCGVVVNWKRVSTFGFCEYDGPTAGLRAVRLLSETEIDGKKLVAKVDAKNKLLLDNYKEEEIKNGGITQTETIDEKTGDEVALKQMHEILEENKHEFEGFDSTLRGDIYSGRTKKPRREDDLKVKALNDNNLEEEKRNLISSEIGKFRKRAEADEHRKELEKEKEKEREKEKEKEREREREKERRKREDKKLKMEVEGDAEIIEKDTAATMGITSTGAAAVNTAAVSNRNNSRILDDMSPSSRKEKDRVIVDNKDSVRRRRTKSHSKERDRELRERERELLREKERERDMRERERVEARERDRGEREREREREREEKAAKSIREARREKEMEEEIRDRKKLEKKAREKEEAYQARLANWEQREKRKAKENEKYRLKELLKQEEREKDAKRLKEFVEDYDDERDDAQYYRGREMQRRLAERVREADADSKDRDKEHAELEELKTKIFNGEYDNPTQEYEKARKELEQLYKPEILIEVTTGQIKLIAKNHKTNEPQAPLSSFPDDRQFSKSISLEPIISSSDINEITKGDGISNVTENFNNHLHHNSISSHNDNHNLGSNTNNRLSSSRKNSESQDYIQIPSTGSPGGESHTNNELNIATPPITMPHISMTLGGNSKKKKIEVATGVFNNDDDIDETVNPKKRKLVPLDYDDNGIGPERVSVTAASAKHTHSTGSNSASNAAITSSGKTNSKHNKHTKHDAGTVSATATTANAATVNATSASATPANTDNAAGTANSKKDENGSSKVHDEKRRHIKSIIDRIPTQKEDLFKCKIDRNEIDNGLMERKVRPWINKKIIEYIGEPEPTLVDFICSKVLAGSSPQSILDDVQMVLDEEAEVFVVKMWRLLIYELDAKKMGLGK